MTWCSTFEFLDATPYIFCWVVFVEWYVSPVLLIPWCLPVILPFTHPRGVSGRSFEQCCFCFFETLKHPPYRYLAVGYSPPKWFWARYTIWLGFAWLVRVCWWPRSVVKINLDSFSLESRFCLFLYHLPAHLVLFVVVIPIVLALQTLDLLELFNLPIQSVHVLVRACGWSVLVAAPAWLGSGSAVQYTIIYNNLKVMKFAKLAIIIIIIIIVMSSWWSHVKYNTIIHDLVIILDY